MFILMKLSYFNQTSNKKRSYCIILHIELYKTHLPKEYNYLTIGNCYTRNCVKYQIQFTSYSIPKIMKP